MPVKVKLSNASRITKRTPEALSAVGMSRLTYQMLGSRVQCRTLVEDYNNGNLPKEYIRLLDELNDLYLTINYPELAAGIVVREGIAELDSYLGSLGITEDYPYDKDAVNIPAWLSIDTQPEYRHLVDESDKTFLTTNNGTEALVVYT